jgi:aminobenzoyl-glutamate utilization protein B
MAHKGMVHAAKYMAMTARDLIADKVLIGEVMHEHREKLRHRPYVCPMPEDVQPVIPPRPENA